MGLVIQAAILLVSLVVSLICFISADLEFSTALRTFRFRFALDWQEIAESMKLYLESPVLTT